MAPRSHFLRPLLRQDDEAYVLKTRGGIVLASTLEPAFDSATRRRGLLGRNGLAEGTAMVIAPCNAVHTFAMRFPIDVVFAARDGRVLKIRPSVPARRLTAAWGAFATVEMAAGSAERAGLQVGDQLVVEPSPRVESR